MQNTLAARPRYSQLTNWQTDIELHSWPNFPVFLSIFLCRCFPPSPFLLRRPSVQLAACSHTHSHLLAHGISPLLVSPGQKCQVDHFLAFEGSVFEVGQVFANAITSLQMEIKKLLILVTVYNY